MSRPFLRHGSSSMLRSLPSLAALALLALAPTAPAQAGKKQEFRSPNAAWQLQVTWGNGADAPEPEPAMAVLVGPSGGSRTFELPFPTAPFEVVVQDDGTTLCFDDRNLHGIGVVLAALDPTAGVRWKRTVEELLPPEIAARLSSGGRTRQWRLRPATFEWSYEAEARTGIALRLWNEDRLHVSLADGSARYEEVLDHGDDARAWFTSARSLTLDRRFEDALPELQRVVELDPHELVAWYELGKCLIRLGRTDDGLAAMHRGAFMNPISKTPEVPGYEETRRNMWLHTRLAHAYFEAGKPELAETCAISCLEIDPALWDAVSIRAAVAWERGELEGVRAFLDKSWRHLAAPPQESVRAKRLSLAAFQVGEFYYERGRHAEARDFYRRGFERGEHHDLLCTRLALCHEQLAEYELAIEVVAAQLENLMLRSTRIEDPVGRQTVEDRILALEQQVARLDELERKKGESGGH